LKGYISISSKDNPSLRDKTNREGLLEQGTAYEDLRMLTLSTLDFLNTEFRKTKDKPPPKHRKARTSDLFLQTEKVEERIKNLQEYLVGVKDEGGQELLGKIETDYLAEKKIYHRQIEIVEDLAGVGISVDAASHDFVMVMNRAIEKINELQSLVRSDGIDAARLRDKVDALHGQVLFMSSLLSGIQPLFRSSRRSNKEIRITDIIETVKRYYATPLKKIHASVDPVELGTPFVLTSNEGVLLQIFINLMDNSVYWLRVSDTKEPMILVQIDGSQESVTFADNGPGVRKQDADYLFQPFFSTKGIHGRGLGLYIARQLTDRYGYDLYYVEKAEDKLLSGANFRIDFKEQLE
jgi:C4-dicarboxylate-specific signal transduction histidine kinase